MSECLLCIDAGQTGVRGELFTLNPDGQIADLVAELDAPGLQSNRPALNQLSQLVVRAADQSPADSRLSVVSAGVSGISADEDVERWLAELPAEVSRVVVAHDSITSYLAALGDRHGAVIACGTGVVTLAVGPDGLTRVDGWGHLLGDAGSGFWIGRAGLDLVMRAYDGRAAATTLTEPVRAEFPDLEEMYLLLQRDPARVSKIASYAKLVSEHAAAGDEGCRRILADAGRELATSVLAALARVGLAEAESPAIGLVGMVFESPGLRDAFETAVREHHGHAQFIRAAKRGLAGARALASLATDSTLVDAVLTARR